VRGRSYRATEIRLVHLVASSEPTPGDLTGASDKSNRMLTVWIRAVWGTWLSEERNLGHQGFVKRDQEGHGQLA
jgi:hypothetical protein